MTQNNFPQIHGLGTTWSFKFYEDIEVNVVYQYLFESMKNFENKYSRFKKDSLLSQLNETKKTPVKDIDLVQMLQLGLEYYKLSNGVFNIATETHQRAQGYDSNYSFQVNTELTPITVSLYEALTVSNTQITLDPRITIDLGGIGKGYLIDKLVSDLKSKFNLKYFVVNGGGDIYATSNFDQPIELFLQHPMHQELVIGKVSLLNNSLCGSTPFMRKWKDKNHILNLKNNSEVLQSSFVTSSDAVTADILATIMTLVDFETALSLQTYKKFEFLQLKGEHMQQSKQFKLLV